MRVDSSSRHRRIGGVVLRHRQPESICWIRAGRHVAGARCSPTPPPATGATGARSAGAPGRTTVGGRTTCGRRACTPTVLTTGTAEAGSEITCEATTAPARSA